MATGASAVGKSPEAFRTISEVAAQLETPAHVLRFWESKFPQIKPVKRAGGRRYYRPDDIALLAGIKVLLHEQGMTIRGVQKLLRERGARHVATLSALPWEGTEPSEEGLPPEEVAADEALEDTAPEAVIVGPWPGTAVEEAEAGSPVGEDVDLRKVAEVPRAVPAGIGSEAFGRLRSALAGADRDRLRDRAGRLAPLVARLRALRDRDAARRP